MSDQLDKPLAYRYEERPRDPPTEREAFAPSESWVNYWDVNPVVHGGKFVRWTGGTWKMVEVTPPSAWPEDAHIVQRYLLEPQDVWADPDDPMTDFTDDMKSILRSLRDEHHLPNAPPFLENVTYYVADLTFYRHGRDETFEIAEDDVDAYWSNLSGYGVDPADVGGVAENSLPDDVTDDD